MSSKDEATFNQRVENLRKAFIKVEAQLSHTTQFFKSDALTNVDIAWLPLLHLADIVKSRTGYDLFCGLAKVPAWQQAVLASLDVHATVSDDFEQKFTNYYLTQTYLGCGEDILAKSDCTQASQTSCCG
ncbi:glutathione S-transferase family protein [Shewanella waksmanii]|uniref:glutathione S-transferase family protein n=1 Tax=Shewanella waksmanii TaxID=213783 RepID=UPI003734DF6F